MPLEGSDQRCQGCDGQGRQAGEVEPSGPEACDFLDCEPTDLQVAAGLPDREHERLTGGRQRHGPAEAVEERRAEVVFELSDRLGHRRLGHAESVSGGREAPFLHHRQEDGQPAAIHM